MMRDTSTFGPDAEVFNPDRWLGGGGKVEEISAVLDLVFWGSEVEYIGRTVAFMELNKVFVEVREIHSPAQWKKMGSTDDEI